MVSSPALDTPVTAGHIFVIAGPSGVGKGTVCRRILAQVPGVALSVSATTRAPRPEEHDGVDYFFWTPETFRQHIEASDMLEWAMYNDCYYGTPAGPVRRQLADGTHVMLEIETQGAMQVRERFADARLIFLAPPSLAILEQRLIDRRTNTPEDIRRRLTIAKQELDMQAAFDHTVINDDLDDCVQAVRAIIAENAVV